MARPRSELPHLYYPPGMYQTRILNPHRNTGGGGGGPLLLETFEGSEVDSQSTSGYDNAGWVANGTSLDPNYSTSPAPFSGSFSFSEQNQHITFDFGSSYSEIHFYAIMSQSRADTSAGFTMGLMDASDAFQLYLRPRGTLSAGLEINGTRTQSSTGLSQDTPYHIWITYIAGAGADGIAEYFVNTSATKPASPEIQISNHSSTGAIKKIRIGYVGGNAQGSIFDNVLVSAEEIGSSPV